MTLQSNPRALVPIAVVAALVAGAVLLAVLVQVIVGLAALLVTGYFAYRIIRFIVKHLASYVAADDDGVTICEFGEETHHHPWDEVTFAGTARAADGMELLYVYVDKDDRLMTVSREFENFTLLGEEVERHIPPTNVQLTAGESLSAHLRQRLPDGGSREQDDDDAPDGAAGDGAEGDTERPAEG
jgi:hypothetical protein